jgi:hypothetical protein
MVEKIFSEYEHALTRPYDHKASNSITDTMYYGSIPYRIIVHKINPPEVTLEMSIPKVNAFIRETNFVYPAGGNYERFLDILKLRIEEMLFLSPFEQPDLRSAFTSSLENVGLMIRSLLIEILFYDKSFSSEQEKTEKYSYWRGLVKGLQDNIFDESLYNFLKDSSSLMFAKLYLSVSDSLRNPLRDLFDTVINNFEIARNSEDFHEYISEFLHVVRNLPEFQESDWLRYENFYVNLPHQITRGLYNTR